LGVGDGGGEVAVEPSEAPARWEVIGGWAGCGVSSIAGVHADQVVPSETRAYQYTVVSQERNPAGIFHAARD
jgi:hypothetical protein